MAKKSGGENKSKAIRDYKKANPKAKPKEIETALTGQGLDVSAAFISTVLSNARRTKSTRGPGRPPKSAATKPATGRRPGRPPASASSHEVSIESLLKAKRIVAEMGSIDEAKAAIDALAKLMK